MIIGFLESIDRFQVRGWAYDTEDQFEYLSVEVAAAGKGLGCAVANLYRKDLDAAGYGNGCHAFILNLEKAISEEQLSDVRAYVLKGNEEKIPLKALSLPARQDKKPTEKISFEGTTSDSAKFPVFVLGAARSGTSVVAQALLQLERFEGEEEGHALDCLAHLLSSLEAFYATKGDELNRNTMVAGISRDYFSDALDNVFCGLANRYYKNDFWVEKTPNSQSVLLAPRYRIIWPNARFIFMKRRGIENIRSRQAKFPSIQFADHCHDWVSVMSAWRAVRDRLGGCAVEIDQLYLAQQPKAAGEFIGRFLGLEEIESDKLSQYFMSERPERTSLSISSVANPNEIAWDANTWNIFNAICSSTMKLFNYGFGSTYFEHSAPEDMARII